MVMPTRAKIGRRMQTEQNLTEADIIWLVVMSEAILRAFTWTQGKPIRELAGSLSISPTTFYATMRLVVAAMISIHRGKKKLDSLVEQLQKQIAELKQTVAMKQSKIESLGQALAKNQAKVSNLQAEVVGLKEQWKANADRLIVVLKLSGHCTVRDIVEVLSLGLGIERSVGYVQSVIAQAGLNGEDILSKLLAVVNLSGAICIDEVYLKELGKRIYGIVIVDPLTGVVLCLKRCGDRSSETIAGLLATFSSGRFKQLIKLCLTDMYKGYLKPIKTYLPNAVHQLCWFHINCFHIGATVRRAKLAYERTVKDLAAFEKKHPAPLSPPLQAKRLALVEACTQTKKYWVGGERFQKMLLRYLRLPDLVEATVKLERIIRVGSQCKNPYVNTMATFLTDHQTGLLAFRLCLASDNHLLQRLSVSQQKWIALTKLWALPITTNAAEHVFRCLRRYTKPMGHFQTETATQRFFDLFVVYHNLRTLREGKRAGNSLLAASLVDIEQLFGTTDPYTILGFPPASLRFATVKCVQPIFSPNETSYPVY
jgi:uncharacterized coiled-coil protein SlyX